MKKKIMKVLGCLFLLGIVVAGGVWWYSRTSNPWNARTVGDISVPVGYTRVEGSYAEFMRRLPLKKRESKVKLFTGGNFTGAGGRADMHGWSLPWGKTKGTYKK